ncbi:MAG: hypothetical protein EOO91_14900 [Pedobacter sp.]|nr:MAG: hypothetical protein EOO91_14900 [Pedobacter sp.]
MKSLLTLLFLINTSFSTTSTTVYLCSSPKATKYHLSAKCRGLINCTYKINKTTLEQAKKGGKTICKWED